MKSRLKEESEAKKSQMKNLTKMYLKAIEDPKIDVLQTVPKTSISGRRIEVKSPISTTRLPTQGGVFKKKRQADEQQFLNDRGDGEIKAADFELPFSAKEIREMIPKTPTDSFISEPNVSESTESISILDSEKKESIQDNLRANIKDFSDAVAKCSSRSIRNLDTSKAYTVTFYKTQEPIPTAHRPKTKEQISNEFDVNTQIIRDYQKKISELEQQNLNLTQQLSSQRTISIEPPRHSDSMVLEEARPALTTMIDALNALLERKKEKPISVDPKGDLMDIINEATESLIQKSQRMILLESKCFDDPSLPNFEGPSIIQEKEPLLNLSFLEDVERNVNLLQNKLEASPILAHQTFEDKVRMMLVSKESEDESKKPDNQKPTSKKQNLLFEPIPTSMSDLDLSRTHQFIGKDRSRGTPPDRTQNVDVQVLFKEVMRVKKQLKRIESNIHEIGIAHPKNEELESVSFNISGVDSSFKDANL
jgi:hypothetical protein